MNKTEIKEKLFQESSKQLIKVKRKYRLAHKRSSSATEALVVKKLRFN